MSSTADQIADSYRQIYPDLNTRGVAEAVNEWWTEEEARTFDIGCPDFHDRPTLILIVEAARSLCGMQRHRAAELLRLAIAATETTR